MLKDFLANLSSDGNALEAFKKDPTHAMTSANLSEPEQKAVLSGDAATIKSMVMGQQQHDSAEGGDHTTVIVVVALPN